MGRYDFEELCRRAIETESAEDMAAMGAWFRRYGERYWNGECYNASLPEEPTGTRNLYPVYVEEEDDSGQYTGDFILTGWTFVHA